VANSGNRNYIVKKLKKMLKDDKNKDYRDQIYFALAAVSLKDADTSAAIDYLAKSVATSKLNTYQKAISSLQLADILFSHKNYKLSQAYYDSTLQFLPKQFPNYKEISKKTATLTDLVGYLQLIDREDSLQKLAWYELKVSVAVIDKIITKLIADEIKEAKRRTGKTRKPGTLFGQSKGQSPGGRRVTGSSGTGSWYFYNPSATSNGYSSFAQKWGHRKLEDNWFLTNKAIVAEIPEIQEDTSSLALAWEEIRPR
jgi:uncharacterized protein YbaA (DUF1428 family)